MWVCPECVEKYRFEEKRVYKIGTGPFVQETRMGICPMCSEYRRLVEVESLKESGIQTEKQEGIECLTH